MIGFSHAAATDMPFSGMLTIAMVCAAVVLGLTRNENSPILPPTPWLALILFGFFLGLAVLAKGPAAIILSGGAVFFWAIFTKRWRDAFRLFHPVALVAFCLTALPWYILCARRNPDFFRIFIIEHNFKRFLTPEFQHIQPFWFYVPIMLLAMLPWTALLYQWSSILREEWRDWHFAASITSLLLSLLVLDSRFLFFHHFEIKTARIRAACNHQAPDSLSLPPISLDRPSRLNRNSRACSLPAQFRLVGLYSSSRVLECSGKLVSK